MPSNYLILCCSLLLPLSIFPSIRVFSNESALRIRWPKYWSFSFSISPSNEYSGLISFRMDGLDLLAVQGNLKSLLQHHSSNASILQCSAFFLVQLSHPYMTTRKTIALIRWNFVSKVKCLFFNILSSFFPNESGLCIRWPKYWSFSFNISPSNEHSGLISFRMDGFDLLAYKGLSRVFSSTTVKKHQFFGGQLSSQSNSHIHT